MVMFYKKKMENIEIVLLEKLVIYVYFRRFQPKKYFYKPI